MATYRQLKGYSVKTVTSDPSNTQFGQIWYNSIAKQIKFTGNAGGAFSSGGNLNTARWNTKATVGTQTAGITFGGSTAPGASMAETEEYDGTSWSEVNDMPTVTTGNGGGGIQTAAFSSGGNTPGDNREDHTFNYDGTSWTSSGDLPFISAQAGACGTQTAGIHCAGTQNPGNTKTNKTAHYDGSSWTDGGNFPINISYHAMAGTQTAALLGMMIKFDGSSPDQTNEFFEYNGSSWSAAGNQNNTRYAGGTFGTQTAAITAGGGSAPAGHQNKVESYDGTSFTNESTLVTGSNYIHGGGTSSAGIIQGGSGPAGSGPNQALTRSEEWNDPSAGTRTMDVS